MYTRPFHQNGSRAMQIPKNYSGNAFSSPREQSQSPPLTDTVADAEESLSTSSPASPSAANAEANPAAIPSAKLLPSLPLHPGKLLSSIGSEELLLLGLILLLAGNDSSSDLLLLLIFLLFIQ